MAEHEKSGQQKQEKLEQKHRAVKQESEPVFDHFHAWEQGTLSIGETPFLPRMDDHAELLARAPSDNHRANIVLQLQQTYGNRYVQRLIKSRVVQAKLNVSAPNDIYEQEADRVAKAVTKADKSQVQRQVEEEEEPIQPKLTPEVQRQAEEEEEEEEPLQTKVAPEMQRQVEEEEEEEEEEEPVQTKLAPGVQRQAEEEEEEEEEPVQTKAAGSQPATVPENLEARIKAERGGGHPLSDNTREPMEQSFGTDFSGVRVHTDSEADALNKQLSAKAFTTGQDVFFRENEYSPGSDSGRELIAHELTHVVQQSGGQLKQSDSPKSVTLTQQHTSKGTVQRMIGFQADGKEWPAGTQIVHHETKEDFKDLEVEKFNPRIQKYFLNNKKTGGMVVVKHDDIDYGTYKERDASRKHWEENLKKTLVVKRAGKAVLDYDRLWAFCGMQPKSDFGYYVWYIGSEIGIKDRRNEFLERIFKAGPYGVEVKINDADKRKILQEMFKEGFRSYEDWEKEKMQQDPDFRFITTGVKLGAEPVGVKEWGFGFRGDSRPLAEVEAAGGFTPKAESKDQDFRKKNGLDQVWNPFNPIYLNELPGQTGDISKRAGYYRSAKTDNDLMTVVSVGKNFWDCTKFPMLEEGYTEEEKVTWFSKKTKQTKTHLYIMIVEEGYDTAKAQGANQFAEVATRAIPWYNHLAHFEVTRTHFGDSANEGHHVYVGKADIIKAAQDQYGKDSNIWGALMNKIKEYEYKRFDYTPAGIEACSCAIRFK